MTMFKKLFNRKLKMKRIDFIPDKEPDKISNLGKCLYIYDNCFIISSRLVDRNAYQFPNHFKYLSPNCDVHTFKFTGSEREEFMKEFIKDFDRNFNELCIDERTSR